MVDHVIVRLAQALDLEPVPLSPLVTWLGGLLVLAIAVFLVNRWLEFSEGGEASVQRADRARPIDPRERVQDYDDVA